MRKLVTSVIVVVLTLASVASANLLLNGDFSQSGVAGQLGTATINNWSTWGTSGYYQSDIGSQYSVKIWWDDSGLWQDWTAVAGQAYQMTVQGQTLSSEPLRNWDGFLQVEWYNSGNGQISKRTVDNFYPTDPTNQWVAVQGVVTAPVGTAYGRILLGVTNWSASASGSVYFDNADVVAIPEPTLAALLGFAGLLFLAGRRIAHRK